MTWLLHPDRITFREQLAELQEQARATSPFGIGALVHGGGVNGFLHSSGSQFPTGWAQAATYDPDLTSRC